MAETPSSEPGVPPSGRDPTPDPTAAARAVEADAVRNHGGWGLWALPLVATIGVMIIALPPERPEEAARTRLDTTDVSDGPKGSAAPTASTPALAVYRGDPSKAEPLSDGAEVRPGEALQVTYTAGGQPHGTILSIDAAGAVRLLWPTESGGTTALDAGTAVALHTPWTVSESPRFERLYFVSAALPLDVDVVQAAAQDLADNGLVPTALALPLQQQVQQTTLLFRKPPKP